MQWLVNEFGAVQMGVGGDSSRSGKVSSVMERACNELNDVPATQNETQFNTEIQLAVWRKESKPLSTRSEFACLFWGGCCLVRL